MRMKHGWHIAVARTVALCMLSVMLLPIFAYAQDGVCTLVYKDETVALSSQPEQTTLGLMVDALEVCATLGIEGTYDATYKSFAFTYDAETYTLMHDATHYYRGDTSVECDVCFYDFGDGPRIELGFLCAILGLESTYDTESNTIYVQIVPAGAAATGGDNAASTPNKNAQTSDATADETIGDADDADMPDEPLEEASSEEVYTHLGDTNIDDGSVGYAYEGGYDDATFSATVQLQDSAAQDMQLSFILQPMMRYRAEYYGNNYYAMGGLYTAATKSVAVGESQASVSFDASQYAYGDYDRYAVYLRHIENGNVLGNYYISDAGALTEVSVIRDNYIGTSEIQTYEFGSHVDVTFALPYGANDSVLSGTCGDNLTWTLDDAGTLTISGTGDMNDYDYREVPWYAYRDAITSVVIEDGVTTIGAWAFHGCDALGSITIPSSATYIGVGAFAVCERLSDVYYTGTQAQWDAITVGANNDTLLNATLHCVTNVTGIHLNQEAAELAVGDVHTLIATVLPEDAINKNVIWTSSNEGVATVVDGIVTAVGAGSATITVTTEDGSYSAACTVTVTAPSEPPLTPEERPVVSVSSIKTLRGKEIIVEVSLTNCAGFADLGIEIDYNSDMLQLTAVENLVKTGNYTPPQTYDKKPYNMWWTDMTNIVHEGVLAKLTFAVAADATPGDYPISVSYYKGINGDYIDGDGVNYDENEKPLRLVYEDGTVSILAYWPGDINGDEKINNSDATALLRYLAGWQTVTVDELALDVNGDGKKNNKDATRLMRYLAGWDVEIY